jgi:3-deoxy-D-manno-octulosonate 8-phosphate phosphatase (KDO 8-P phosphatase)
MPSEAPAALEERCRSIELLVTDVDGVLTNGVIALDDAGVETKNFHVRDGMALSLWHRAGKQAAILSSRRSGAVDRRAAELKITHVVQGCEEKTAPLQALISQLGLAPRQVCFMGDDLADLPVLQTVGLAACPADAVAEVKNAVHFVTQAPGGRGAIRELVELILKSQGSWTDLVSRLFSRP